MTLRCCSRTKLFTFNLLTGSFIVSWNLYNVNKNNAFGDHRFHFRFLAFSLLEKMMFGDSSWQSAARETACLLICIGFSFSLDRVLRFPSFVFLILLWDFEGNDCKTSMEMDFSVQNVKRGLFCQLSIIFSISKDERDRSTLVNDDIWSRNFHKN